MTSQNNSAAAEVGSAFLLSSSFSLNAAASFWVNCLAFGGILKNFQCLTFNNWLSSQFSLHCWQSQISRQNGPLSALFSPLCNTCLQLAAGHGIDFNIRLHSPQFWKSISILFCQTSIFLPSMKLCIHSKHLLKMPHVVISTSWPFKTFWKMFFKEFLAGIRTRIIYTNVHKARPNRNRFWRQCNRICCVPQGPIKCKTTSPSIPGIYWASSAGYPWALQQKTNRSGD